VKVVKEVKKLTLQKCKQIRPRSFIILIIGKPIIRHKASIPNQSFAGNQILMVSQISEKVSSTTLFFRLTEILEAETEIYMRKDPDPFDERHPSRTDPTSELGKNLKILFRKDNFMNYLVNDYLRDTYFSRLQIEKSALSLNIAACRLILVIMPGLETSAVFQAQYDQLIVRLYGWAENGEEPLRSYAVGLLGAAMDIQEIAVTFRDQNIRMLPLMLQRLRELQLKYRKYGNVSWLDLLIHLLDL
jgi:hypothetical protein